MSVKFEHAPMSCLIACFHRIRYALCLQRIGLLSHKENDNNHYGFHVKQLCEKGIHKVV